jgi:hypothetical protein
MLRFSSTEGFHERELVVGQHITSSAETSANGSRTRQVRPP